MKKRLPWLIGLLVILFANFTASAQVPERKGWWKFDDAANLLKADIGTSLTGDGTPVEGPTANNKAIQVALGSYLTMNHGIAANGGGTTVNEYTLQIDFSIPETGKWHAFFQTDPAAGNLDAELFTNTSNAIGVADAGYTSKTVSANTWYRMLVSVKNGEFLKIYVDGVLWLDGTSQPVDDRFGLLSSLLIFHDNDGDDATINCSELGIWDVALDADQAAALGGANNAHVPVRTKLGWWKFDDTADLLKAEIGSPLVLTGTQESVTGPTIANKAVNIPLGSSLKMTHGILPNGGGTKINEYSVQLDFSIPEVNKWHAFIQTNTSDNLDAELFTNTTNNIGTRATGYSTNFVSANTWYRMVISVKNGEFFKVYINGELWLDGIKQDIDGRFSLLDNLSLFADDDGDDAAILCSEAAIWEVALTEAEVLALGADPTAQIPERMGLWKFDDPSNMLKADAGLDLGETGPNSSVEGPVSGNNAIEVPLGSYLTMKHGSYGNGGGLMVNEYTLQIDFSVPEIGAWHAFFQTDTGNAGDADLFTSKSTNAIGTAQTSYTTKTITANTWYRMLVTVKNGEFFKVYMDGELWLDGAGQEIDGRFALADLLLLFGDDDGDDGLINCSEVAFWDVALNPDQAAKLGTASTVITGIAQQNLSGSASDLGQNYPNPFSNSTIFPYQIQKAGNVSFRVMDIAGKELRVINEGVLSPGKYNLEIHSDHLKNGIYFLQMKSEQGVMTRKMVVAQ